MAAACLSPSPSGRRLSELLEEKQEPFVLDLHLLEKGCSSSRLLLDDTALCWPAAPGNDAAAVLKRLTSKKSKKQAAATRGGNKNKKQQQQQQAAASGLLKLLLSKVLRGKQAPGCKKPAALQYSDSFKVAGGNKPAAVAPAPCADDHLSVVRTAEGGKKQEAERCAYDSYDYDSDSEEDDDKQLSPVSVLEHPFESSPVHGKLLSPSKNSKNYAVDVFRELLDAAYSPALLTQLLADSDDLATDSTSSSSTDEDDEDCYGYPASPKNSGAYWEAHRAELARVSELVASEVPTARLDHAALLPERECVGAAVSAAVLHALLNELVVDLGTC